MSDFLAFRRMIAPAVIQILFWAAFLAVVVLGVAAVVIGAHQHRAREVLGGFALLLFGPFVFRLSCEVLIVFFRINDSLVDIQKLATWAAERTYARDEEENRGDEEDGGEVGEGSSG